MGDTGGLESRGSRFVMASYRNSPRGNGEDSEKTTPTTPRKNESPLTPRKEDDGNAKDAAPTKQDLSLKGKIPAASASVSSPRGPSPSTSSLSPWSPRSNSTHDISRYRDSADILLLRLANGFFDLANKTQAMLPSLERVHTFTGEEIQNKIMEWLECDKDTSFLIASTLLQQGFFTNKSMGVFIDTAVVSYNIKDPILTHYARCMKRGVDSGLLKTTLKKNKSSKVEEESFTGVDAVEWMLLNFPHLVKKLRVESVGNAVAVAEALVEQGFIENLRQKPDSKKLKPFAHDEKQLYRFNNRLFKTRPVGGKALLLNPLPAQLDYVVCESLLDGLAPLPQLITSKSETTTPRKVGFDS